MGADELWLPTDEELAQIEDLGVLEDVLAAIEAELGHEARWRPQPKQARAEYLSAIVDELLYGGATYGGKTYWGVNHCIDQCERHPGNRVLILRRVYPSLEENVIPLCQELLEGRATWNANKHLFRFPNRSVLRLGHLQHEDSWRNYQGASYGCIFWEELTEFLQAQYEKLMAWVRAPVDGVRAHVIATTNPGGIGHKWVKRRFIRPLPDDLPDNVVAMPGVPWTPRATEEVPNPGTRAFLPALAEDNPVGMARNPDYLSRALGSISHKGTRLAFRTGDWDAIDAVEGALWTQTDLDKGRILWDADERRRARMPGWNPSPVPAVQRAIAVDSSDGEERGDAYGIVAGSLGYDGVLYVEGAWELKGMSTREMASRTLRIYNAVGADTAFVERNHGGKWLIETLQEVDRYANIQDVWASEKKIARAEPVAALFQPLGPPVPEKDRFRARMVGTHEDLEEELTTTDFRTGASPNLADALVWLGHGLVVGKGLTRVDRYDDQRLRGRR